MGYSKRFDGAEGFMINGIQRAATVFVLASVPYPVGVVVGEVTRQQLVYDDFTHGG
jgi:hypothetical protein